MILVTLTDKSHVLEGFPHPTFGIQFKNQIMKIRTLFWTAALFAHFTLFGQTVQPVQSSSEVLIHGTSTLHDWTMHCDDFSGSAQISYKNGIPVAMEQLNFEIGVKGIKSGKSAMDSNTYKAMKAEKHPKVVFRSTNIRVTPKGAGVVVAATGKLTIAGVTKPVTLHAQGVKSGTRWVFTGEQNIHTPDYGVEPVSAMMGTIRTGADVVIDFDIVY